MNIGFTWESAEPAEPKDLADKVKNLIKDKNLFIGICTRKEAVIGVADLSRNKLRRKLLNGPEDRFSSKTSDWIIQEIGLAIGREMDLILLVESGVRQPGGLQGNLEYIEFERSAPEKSFGKLLEMLQALRPTATSVLIPETEMSAAAVTTSPPAETTSPEWLQPKQEWHRQDYEFAVFHMILTGDIDGEKGINDAYLASEDGQIEANIPRWEARREYLRLDLEKGGALTMLERIANKYRENSDVQKYLGLGYQRYTEHDKAGESFLVAADTTEDKKVILARLGDAAIAFVQAGRKERSQEIVTKMKAVALQVEGGEANLVDTLRKVADIEKEKHLSFGLTERLLQLHPDNVEARFSLAFNYSNSNQNDSRFTTI